MNGKGRAGEEFAAEILTEQGYKIEAVNFFSPYGEVDIIASRGGSLCFVEVKTRRKNPMVSGAQSVTRSKQRKIIKTALAYMQEKGWELQPRFDVFSVTTDENGTVTGWDHIKEAFNGDAYKGD